MEMGYKSRLKDLLSQNLCGIGQWHDHAASVSDNACHFGDLLGTIMGLAETCLDQLPQDSLLNKNLDTIIQVSHKACDLVKQILILSGRDSFDIQRVKVSEFISMSEGLMRANLVFGILFKVEIPPEVGNELIAVDITRMAQVFYNLCENAIDAMNRRGGELTICAGVKSPQNIPDGLHALQWYVCLQVIDTGEGIAQEIRDRIFDPFFTTKSVEKGTGLGLASVRSIIAEHGGTIEVESEVDKGTIFSIFLPRSADV